MRYLSSSGTLVHDIKYMSVMLKSHEMLKFMMSQSDILQGHALHAHWQSPGGDIMY